jgi:hypothetical protein
MLHESPENHDESGPCEKTPEDVEARWGNARRRGCRHSDNVNGAILLAFAMSTVLSTTRWATRQLSFLKWNSTVVNGAPTPRSTTSAFPLVRLPESKYRHYVDGLTSLACLTAVSLALCRTDAGSQIAGQTRGSSYMGRLAGKVAVVTGASKAIGSRTDAT